MKKIVYTLAILLGIASAAQAQNKVTMTLNVDHADRVTVKYYDASYNEVIVDNLKDGDNSLTVPVGNYSKSVDIIAKEGFGLESCTFLNPGETAPSSADILYMKSAYFNASADPSTQDAVWTVRTFAFDDARTAHATFIVDDPAKVKVTRVASNTLVDLSRGDNNVAFIPAAGDKTNESVFSIVASNNDKPLYKVSVNDVQVEGYDSDNSYVTINDNDIVKIEANFPDIDVPVNFTYSDKGFGFVTKVAADGVEIPFDGNNLSVKCGSKVEFWYNDSDYILSSISINGQKVEYPWSPISLGIVTEETTVAIDASKVGNYTFDVKVNDASYIKLLAFEQGASIYYGGKEINLVSGENKDVEVSDKLHYFSIEATTRSKLKALTLNGVKIEQEEKTDYSGGTYLEWPFPIEIKQGDVLEITGAGPERDNEAILYIDKIPEGSYSFSFNMNGYSPAVKEGYNFIKFDDNTDAEVGDLPFNISLYYSPMQSWLYINDQTVEPNNESAYSSDYKLTEVAPNSVLKLFTEAQPLEYNVTMTLEGIQAENIAVTKDHISKVASPAQGFKVIGPTAVKIEGLDYDIKEVKANGETIVPDNNGAYTLLVEADTTIEVTGKRSAVEECYISDATDSVEVYTIQGIKVKNAATKADLNSLPHGFYIINGKKVKL